MKKLVSFTMTIVFLFAISSSFVLAQENETTLREDIRVYEKMEINFSQDSTVTGVQFFEKAVGEVRFGIFCRLDKETKIFIIYSNSRFGSYDNKSCLKAIKAIIPGYLIVHTVVLGHRIKEIYIYTNKMKNMGMDLK